MLVFDFARSIAHVEETLSIKPGFIALDRLMTSQAPNVCLCMRIHLQVFHEPSSLLYKELTGGGNPPSSKFQIWERMISCLCLRRFSLSLQIRKTWEFLTPLPPGGSKNDFRQEKIDLI